LPDRSFDLVVVDFLEAPAVTRVDCIKAAMKKVSPGGYLLLDDSDRPGYAEAFELLDGWRFRRFTGVKDEWPEACETGIFERPGHRRSALCGTFPRVSPGERYSPPLPCGVRTFLEGINLRDYLARNTEDSHLQRGRCKPARRFSRPLAGTCQRQESEEPQVA